MRNRLKYFVVFLIPLLAKSQSISTSSLFAVFGGPNDETGFSIKQTLDSGYIVTGQTNSFGSINTDIYIAKTDKYLIPKWQKNIGGFLSDVGKSIIELQDSSIVIAGFSNSFGNGGYDALIVKTDKNGNLIWQKNWGGLDWDFANSISKTSDGNLIISGNTYSYGKGSSDGFILKMDLNGSILWQKIYGGTNYDDYKNIIQTGDGGYIAVGTTMSFGDALGDVFISKFNLSGDSVWFKTVGGNKYDKGNDIVQDENNDYLITGGTRSYSLTNDNMDAFIFKLSNSSNLVWTRNYGGNGDEESYSVKNSKSNYGKLVITYETKEVPGFEKDIKTILLDGSGYYVRGGSFGSNKNDVGLDIQNTYDKGYVTCGYSEGFNAQMKDIFIVKYDSEMTIGPQMVDIKINSPQRKINVYPSVVNNKNLNIETEFPIQNKQEIIKIFDIRGVQMHNYKIELLDDNFVKVYFSDIENGIYFLKLNQFVFKFIIQE